MIYFSSPDSPSLSKQIADSIRDRNKAIKEALAPAPMFRTKTGFYFQGTVVEYLRGLHMDPKDPASSDQIVFRAYGRNGGQKSRKTARISTRYIRRIIHDYDTTKDFVWRFSNRHELLNEPFGSKRHRQSIYALFDSDGEMGLSGGERFPFGRELKEGLFTRFLVEGLPPIGEQLKRLLWNMSAPYSFMGPVQGVNRAIMWFPLRPTDLFTAMARARVYDIAEPGIAKLARHGASILCTMALADPEIASGARRSIAQRAQLIGEGCYQTVVETLWATYKARKDRVGALPVKPLVLQEVVLEFVLSEDVFRNFLNSSYTNRDGKNRPRTDGLISRSHDLTQILAAIGGGRHIDHTGTVRQKLATAALERMITTVPGKSAEEREYNELQSRTFRKILINDGGGRPSGRVLPADSFKRRAWVYAMFCRVGWGHSDDIIPIAEQALDIAQHLIYRDERGKVVPSEQLHASEKPKIALNLRLIAMILKSARRGDRHENLLLDAIEKKLDKLRESARNAYTDVGKATYKRLFGMLEEFQAAGGRCT